MLGKLAIVGLVLGCMAGCGSCVKDDPQPAPPVVGEGVPPRKPLNMKAVQKGLSQFSDAAEGDASSSDAATD